MDSTTRITFSAVSHIGTACTINDDRIYANGKFARMNDADCLQISLEDSGDQFIFALVDGMDDVESGISVINELRKYQSKSKNNSKNIQVKADELVECVEQTSNLLYSLSIGEKILQNSKTAFSGLLIDNGCIVAVNMGASRIYKLDGDNFKLVVNDYRRAERLLKMGIINDEQAELLSGQRKPSTDEDRQSVKRSDIYPLKEGVTYLLCSSGLKDSVSEDAIYDIIDSNIETDEIAAQLVEEALKNGSADNITAAVVHIGKAGATANAGAVQPGRTVTRSEAAKSKSTMVGINQYARNFRKKTIDVSKLISALIVVVVIAAVVFAAFTMYLKSKPPQSEDTSAPASTSALMQSSTTSGALSQDSAGSSSVQGNPDTAAKGSNAGKTVSGTTGSTSNSAVLIPAGGTTYKVKRGDKLMKIATQFYGDESKYRLIMDANKIVDPNKINVDDVLKIPPLK